MKLVGFTVENFRSITKAHKLRLDHSTTLLGPNNEGKSNILRALVLSMQILTRYGRFRSARAQQTRAGVQRLPTHIAARRYRWDRDFPVHLRASKPSGKSVFVLEFNLTKKEVSSFKSELGSDLNGTLPLRIALDDAHCEIKVNKKGASGFRVGRTAGLRNRRMGRSVA